MNEIIFLVEEADEGGFIARALGESIFTEADDLKELHRNIREAVLCHFDDGKAPKVIRLHFVREEVTVPNHDPIKVGTLAAIVSDVSAQLDIPREELVRKLFG